MNARLTAISWLDWKLGARLLLKYPALTIIGGLSLAGAIAIGAVGIELADELLYKRLPFDEGSRVVRLETQDTAASRVEPRVLHDFAIWRRSLKTVAELGAARVSERNVLTGEGRFESLRVAEITASAFPLTRVPPLLGRPLQPTDEMQGAEPVVVLGYDVWQRQFLHDPAIIGRVVTVGRTARTVVGVMPPRFGFPHNEQAMGALAQSRTRRRAKGRPCRCSVGSPTERAGRMPRRRSTSSRHAWPPTSRPPTRSCGRGFAHSPGARRVIRCSWKIWRSTPSSCCCWGRCRRTSRR